MCIYRRSSASSPVLPTDLWWKDHKTWWWHLHDAHTALPLRLRRAWRDIQQHPHGLVSPWARSLCCQCQGSKKKLLPWLGCPARLVKSVKGQGDFPHHYSLDRSWNLAHIGCSNVSLLGTLEGLAPLPSFSLPGFILSVLCLHKDTWTMRLPMNSCNASCQQPPQSQEKYALARDRVYKHGKTNYTKKGSPSS